MAADRFANEAVYTPNEGFYGMLGLARRAGKVTPGTGVLVAALRRGEKPPLVVIDAAASLGTKSRIWGLCHAKGVTYVTVSAEGRLGDAVGITAPLSALSIRDAGFATRLRDMLTAIPSQSATPQEKRR